MNNTAAGENIKGNKVLQEQQTKYRGIKSCKGEEIKRVTICTVLRRAMKRVRNICHRCTKRATRAADDIYYALLWVRGGC